MAPSGDDEEGSSFGASRGDDDYADLDDDPYNYDDSEDMEIATGTRKRKAPRGRAAAVATFCCSTCGQH